MTADAKFFDLVEPAATKWIKSRPKAVRSMIRAYPPNLIYTLGDRQRCTIYSYSEDGTITVNITQELNPECDLWLMDRQVFGILPSDLQRVSAAEWDFVRQVRQ